MGWSLYFPTNKIVFVSYVIRRSRKIHDIYPGAEAISPKFGRNLFRHLAGEDITCRKANRSSRLQKRRGKKKADHF